MDGDGEAIDLSHWRREESKTSPTGERWHSPGYGMILDSRERVEEVCREHPHLQKPAFWPKEWGPPPPGWSGARPA